MLISMPNQATVKYNAAIYPTEEICMQARDGYLQAYKEKSAEYKFNMKTEAFCIPFESFPIKGMQSPIGA